MVKYWKVWYKLRYICEGKDVNGEAEVGSKDLQGRKTCGAPKKKEKNSVQCTRIVHEGTLVLMLM